MTDETQEQLHLADLKAMHPKELVTMAEELEIENATTMRKGEIMFSILKERAEEGWMIGGEGVLEVLQDGFGFLRAPEANYLLVLTIFMSRQKFCVSFLCARVTQSRVI